MTQVSLSRRVDALSDFRLWQTAEDIRMATNYMDAEQEAMVVQLGETDMNYVFTMDERHALENIIIGAVDSGAYELDEDLI